MAVSFRQLAFLVVLSAGALPPIPDALQAVPPASGPASDTLPPDTFADAGAREMIRRARAARGSEAEGLWSYEATVREWIFVGLSVPRFRRDRALYRSERVARVRWSPGSETVRWLGIRSRIPVAGVEPEEDEDDDEDLEEFPLDPTGDRLRLAGSPFLHPLADSAGRHYTYASGDTLAVVLTASGRKISVAEVRVFPRRTEFGLLAGSLWFDLETAALVRGAFRPARPFDLELDEPEDAAEVPGFLKPIRVRIDHMIVDYALRDLRWWLPHRLRFEGEARLGNAIRLPAAIELEAGEFELNAPGDLDPGRRLPEGWRRIEISDADVDSTEKAAGDSARAAEAATPAARRVIIFPPRDSLRSSPLLVGKRFGSGPRSFTRAELKRLRASLRTTAAGAGSLSWRGVLTRRGLLRYNRIEGLSGGVARQGPLAGAVTGRAELRIGVADRVPNLELTALEIGRAVELEGAAYYALRFADEWGNPLGLEASFSALLLGYDDGQYYRAGGASMTVRRTEGAVRWQVRGFLEAQRSVDRETDVSVSHLLGGGDFPPNIRADAVELAGAAARATVQVGRDPDELVATVSARGEAAVGGARYGRIAGEASAAGPLLGALSGSVQLGAGTTIGSVPVQRLYFLGGPRTLRAFPGGSFAGTAFWLARGELAYGRPLVRLVTFADLGWAGDRPAFGADAPGASAGVGVSILDGIARLDLARALRGRDPGAWRVHLYLDGAF